MGESRGNKMDILQDNSTQETSLIQAAETFKKENDAQGLRKLIDDAKLLAETIRKLNFSKVKGNQVVKILVENYLMVANPDGKVDALKDLVSWADQQNRRFLKKHLQVRLVEILYEVESYQEGLQTIPGILPALNKDNDKELLVQVYLLESKCFYNLNNYEKAKVSVTSARAAGNSIYVHPALQAGVDLEFGLVHAALNQDFQTASSYFAEAFRLYAEVQHSQASTALKYLLMAQIMAKDYRAFQKNISREEYEVYQDEDTLALVQICKCVEAKSLPGFKEQLSANKVLIKDPVMKLHLSNLEDVMSEYSIQEFLKAYSRVQVDHIAEKLDMPLDQIERKVSCMILDGKISGVLDQQTKALSMFPPNQSQHHEELTQTSTLFDSLNNILNRFYARARNLFQ